MDIISGNILRIIKQKIFIVPNFFFNLFFIYLLILFYLFIFILFINLLFYLLFYLFFIIFNHFFYLFIYIFLFLFYYLTLFSFSNSNFSLSNSKLMTVSMIFEKKNSNLSLYPSTLRSNPEKVFKIS